MAKVTRKEKLVTAPVKQAAQKKAPVPKQATKVAVGRGVTLLGANPEAVKQAILDFGEAHEGVLIHPKQNVDKLIEQMIKLGYCPCLRTALSCPHPNVETQIKAEGKCVCGLFVTEAYLKQFYVLKDKEWQTKSEKAPVSVGKAWYWSPEKGWFKEEKTGGNAESWSQIPQLSGIQDA